MSLSDLLPALQSLGRGEKLLAIRYLADELAREDASMIAPDQAYPVWSPFDAHDAAGVLLRALEADRGTT